MKMKLSLVLSILSAARVGAQTYIPITESDQWRIITSESKSGWALDLLELNFYSDASCSKDSKVNPNGEPIDSGNAGGSWLPKYAFNTPGRYWGGRKSDGFFWIGMRFTEVITVKCIDLLQGADPHYGPEWTVEARQAGSWAKVAEKKNILPSKEHVGFNGLNHVQMIQTSSKVEEADREPVNILKVVEIIEEGSGVIKEKVENPLRSSAAKLVKVSKIQGSLSQEELGFWC
eukprot:CAMPEP_0194315902 /NCGR_PEP_ID=MMETSP0171-20130528/12687_1 /TAXON_ID=218684 /ORGANISM="Corethron pennatum, Strain L29A3" /LENGTH=231 /DNA_ID=CAMNT_0039071915 /DNA_START=143 /DNA_END=839 /DNA_ORIENTATION=+